MKLPRNTFCGQTNRREFLHTVGGGFTSMALTGMLANDGFFKGTTTQVKQWRKTTLHTIATLVKSYPGAPVTISGFTDNIFPRKERFHRSLLTAQAVAAYLWNHGESMSRVKLKLEATRKSVSSNRTPDGQADNRRVEIYIGLATA